MQTMAPAKKHIKTNFSSNWISARGRDMKKPARPKKAITPAEKTREKKMKKRLGYIHVHVCSGPKEGLKIQRENSGRGGE